MSQERNAEVERLFDELMELGAAARQTRLGQLASTPDVSPALAGEVASLVAAADLAGDFLGVLTPAIADSGVDCEPGDVIAGRYRLQSRLGQGTTGDVHLAWDNQLERPVALKFLRGTTSDDFSGRARFLAEARAAAKLDHRHVATVHDVGEDANRRAFIAMAYYPGETLRDRIAKGALPLTDALRIAAQIASALDAAHSAGIVHRDVKPANVLFDADGAVKLADFGAAMLMTGSMSTKDEVTIGTIAYMSPEQARGEPVDNRTDLWALGVLLYEMLAGVRPFTASNAETLLLALTNDDPAPPLPDEVHATTEIRELIASLLTNDAARRVKSAAIVSHALTDYMNDDVTTAAARTSTSASIALPSPVTSFVGRERELALARDLLSQTRLLTLTGPGGTGKTRLALQLAATLHDEGIDGIWFVPLAEISDPSLVPSILAQTMGLRDLGGGNPRDRVITALRERRAFVVLDNFEHVIQAATFVSALLARCPRVSVLVTSRIPLGVQGEQELSVPPLTTPSSTDSDAASSEAVRLFVQRARAVRPDFTLNDDGLLAVAEICRRLDGLPLALELAAARAKLLSPRAMLARLESRFDLLQAESYDRPARHSTMRNVIDWSYVLLTDAERTLFNTLSVFAAGVSIEAAEAMYDATHLPHGEPHSSFAVLDLLGSLCNKSLLRQEEQSDGEPRFVMLETVREFALDRLRATGGETEARRAHCAYFLSLAERAAKQLRGPAQAEWLDRLEREYANCRIAIDTALGDARAQSPEGLVTAARLAIALHRLWLTRGPLLEGVEYLRRVTRAADDAAAREAVNDPLDVRLRADLLSSAGQLANVRSVFPEAHDLFARSLALHREARDEAGIATTLNNLAWSAWIIGDMNAGEQMATTAMEMHEKSGDALGATLSLNTLGWIAMERGQYARAEKYFADAVASHQQRGDRRAAAFTVGWMGVLAARRGDYPRAIELQTRAIDMLEPVADQGYRVLSFVRLAAARHAAGEPGDHVTAIEMKHLPELHEQGGRLWPIAYTLTELGAMLRDEGRFHHAHRILDEALDVRRQTGGLHGVAEARLLLGTVLQALGDEAQARDELARALTTARDFGAIPVAIDCIEAIAMLTLAPDHPELATTLLAAARQGRDTLGARRAPRYDAAYERSRLSLLSTMGENTFDRAWRSGATTSVDDAITLALHSHS